MKVAEIITNKIIEIIENGNIAVWQAGWLKHKSINGNEYKGSVNRMLLNYASYKRGFKYPIWLTFNKARELNLKVVKGAKSEMITYYAKIEKKHDSDIIDENNAIKEDDCYYLLKYFNVFNIEQIENYQDLDIIKDFNKNKESLNKNELDDLINSYIKKERIGFNIGGDRAFYGVLDDAITMPCKEIFINDSEYYHTLSHEAIHSTGAEKRLNRIKIGGGIYSIDNNEYNFEELVAEIGACALSSQYNIPADINNSASYIDGWAKYLKENKKTAIFQASNLADKAINFIQDINI
ncbi:MAG: zincin-like metallopeptidase domain-containing protein [bacterium]